MAALRLELRPSPALAATLVLVHAAGAGAAMLAAPGLAGAALGGLIVCLGGAAAWHRALLRGPRAIRVLELSADGTLQAHRRSGERALVQGGARCHVGPWWVLVPLGRHRGTALVARDMLAPAEFRWLRLWALWGRVPASVGPAAAG